MESFWKNILEPQTTTTTSCSLLFDDVDRVSKYFYVAASAAMW
jgi:hypothetical protein